MTYCGTLAEPITRRVAEGMNLDDIANEMCTSVKDPRQKLIRIIKELLGEDYLIENSEVLQYDVGKAKLGRIPKHQTLREIKTEGDSVSKVSSCKASVSKPSEKSCASKVSERKPSSKISVCEPEKVESPMKEPIAYSSSESKNDCDTLENIIQQLVLRYGFENVRNCIETIGYDET